MRMMLSFVCVMLCSSIVLSEEERQLRVHSKIIEMNKIAQGLREQHEKLILELDEKCCRIAQEWANHMAKKSKFHHGKHEQIIARGYKDVHTTFKAWMKSRGHRKWMLSNSKKCGWGCQKSKSGKWYWVGVFR